MQRRYVTVDVFTNRIFGGNPLAVVLDAQGLSAEQMQAIAAEFNYAETTFVLPPCDPSHTARVRQKRSGEVTAVHVGGFATQVMSGVFDLKL
jgi:PhzF family phenazine biosynthesis protein